MLRVLIPTVTIAKDQACFRTKSWQQGELQAERDVENDRLTDISKSNPKGSTNDVGKSASSLVADQENGRV